MSKEKTRTMGVKRWMPVALIVFALLAVGVTAGCGGPSSGATTGSSADSSGSTESSGGSKAPAAGFSKKAKSASYGEESDEAEREQASEILELNLKARASGDYVVQCGTMSPRIAGGVGNNGSKGGEEHTCAETLESEAPKAPPAVLENPMTEPIAALRVRGPLAYALFHGKGGKDYAMKMETSNGKWMVAATLTEELP